MVSKLTRGGANWLAGVQYLIWFAQTPMSVNTRMRILVLVGRSYYIVDVACREEEPQVAGSIRGFVPFPCSGIANLLYPISDLIFYTAVVAPP